MTLRWVTIEFLQNKLGTDVVVLLATMKPQAAIPWNEYELSTFLLSEEAVKLASAGDTQRFREHRRIMLLDYLPKFVSDRIGDTVDIRPSIQSILHDADVAAIH